MKKPELLSPAGDKDSFYEAIASGADAVYLAGKSFGARAFANNFTNEELKEIISYAHLYDKKVYVTVNTIIFEDELDKLKEYLDFLYLNKCDAIITQDLGVANFVFHNYPLFPIHASTQMNVKSVEEALVLKELGFSRIILARETPLEKIKEIKEKVDIELEVFVHGALCVSMSGNCLFSSFAFKRSGNRGECAGNCRLPYTLDEKEKGYLLSTKDLCTINHLDELMKLGIDSFKIEGRMKRSEYVRVITLEYKNRIESILKGNYFKIDESVKNLKVMFNRGFTHGFMFKADSKELSNIDSPNHIGIYIGKVVSSINHRITIILEDDLEYLDSIRVKSKTKEDAITINEMLVKGVKVKKAIKGDRITILSHSDGLEGAEVYKTTSSKLINEDLEKLKIKINGRCFLHENRLALKAYDDKFSASLALKEEVEKSNNANYALRIKEQIEKTGNTPFVFENIEMDIPSDIYVPISEVNNLRRKVLEKLSLKRQNIYEDRQINITSYNSYQKKQDNYLLKVRVNEEKQLLKVLEVNNKYHIIDEIYINDYDLYKSYKGNKDIPLLKYYLPREETKAYDNEVVTSSVGNVKGNTVSCYMNVANSLAVNLLDDLGAKTIGLSLELTKKDIKNLIENYKNKLSSNTNFEIMVYGYVEVMYSKYCLLNKMGLCGKCKGVHFLKDRKNFVFPLVTTTSCYMKIYNSKRIHLINHFDELKELGVNSFLIDFSIEKEEEIEEVLEMYIKKYLYEETDVTLENATFGHFKEGVRN